jgi:hypothetical protein
MKKPLVIGMVGYDFMGRAHFNAWRQVGRFFDLPADLRLKTLDPLRAQRRQRAESDLARTCGGG